MLEFNQIRAESLRNKDGTVAIPNQIQVTAVSMGLGTVCKDYVRSLLVHYEVYDEIAVFKKPVKILLGTNDGLFTESAMRKAVNAYGDNASYEMVQGGAHNFMPNILETLCPDTVLPFLNGLIK